MERGHDEMKQRLYFAAGLIFFALGAAGIPLPLLPTVPFWLLAVFFFARSNKAWEERLLNHPKFGAQIRNWREHGTLSRRSKIVAITSIAAGAVLTWVTVGFPWVWISIAVLFVSGTWLATRPE
ncbi:MAG: YbaN family protein [Erythrobacter sp.]|uniref:YbaN family protein n=1 Tax=Erythrobacter sp. TaxID=1042 RepID=UPI00326368CA